MKFRKVEGLKWNEWTQKREHHPLICKIWAALLIISHSRGHYMVVISQKGFEDTQWWQHGHLIVAMATLAGVFWELWSKKRKLFLDLEVWEDRQMNETQGEKQKPLDTHGIAWHVATQSNRKSPLQETSCTEDRTTSPPKQKNHLFN